MKYAPPWETPTTKPLTGKNAKDPTSESSIIIARRDENGLTPSMKARRDAFVIEYLVDFKQTQAAIRIGIPATSAPKQASELMREPYVARQVQIKLEEAEEANLVTRNRILGGLLREAGFEAPGASHAARVNAWGKLAGILGMEVKKLELSAPEPVALTITIGDHGTKLKPAS